MRNVDSCEDDDCFHAREDEEAWLGLGWGSRISRPLCRLWCGFSAAPPVVWCGGFGLFNPPRPPVVRRWVLGYLSPLLPRCGVVWCGVLWWRVVGFRFSVYPPPLPVVWWWVLGLGFRVCTRTPPVGGGGIRKGLGLRVSSWFAGRNSDIHRMNTHTYFRRFLKRHVYTNIYIHIHVYLNNVNMYMYICIYIYMYIYIYVYIYMYIYVYIYVYVYMYIYIYVYIYTYMYIYMYTYIYIYV